MYVEELIGRNTVSTMPLETLAAFRDHGNVADTLAADLDGARRALDAVERAGISLTSVTDGLLRDGVKKFVEPFNRLQENIQRRRSG
jgi:transaldolase